MTVQWLECKVLKGMFSDERTIVYEMSNGDESSAFVPSSYVRGDLGTKGTVKVEVFQDEGTTWAVLPTEYRETVPVSEQRLTSA